MLLRVQARHLARIVPDPVLLETIEGRMSAMSMRRAQLFDRDHHVVGLDDGHGILTDTQS